MSTAAYSAKLEAFQAGLAKAKERDKRAIAKDKAGRRKAEAVLRKSATPHCHRPVVEALVKAEIKGGTSFQAWSNARLARIRNLFEDRGNRNGNEWLLRLPTADHAGTETETQPQGIEARPAQVG